MTFNKNSRVIWEGPSRIDGSPIMVVVTGLARSKNRKTGNMAQAYIMPQNEAPPQAVQSGADKGVCGNCPLRGKRGKRRACYVNLGQGPGALYQSWSRGRIDIGPVDLEGRPIRLGAWGDPCAVPIQVWADLLKNAGGWTGYTHQWRKPENAPYREFLHASVGKNDKALAEKRGWKWFQVVPQGETGEGGTECPASQGETTCADCRACRGSSGRNIWIEAHGSGKIYVT